MGCYLDGAGALFGRPSFASTKVTHSLLGAKGSGLSSSKRRALEYSFSALKAQSFRVFVSPRSRFSRSPNFGPPGADADGQIGLARYLCTRGPGRASAGSLGILTVPLISPSTRASGIDRTCLIADLRGSTYKRPRRVSARVGPDRAPPSLSVQ